MAGNRGMHHTARVPPVTPEEAARALGHPTRAGKIACPHGHRKGLVWCKTDRTHWRCMDCCKSGDAIDLIMLLTGQTFLEAREYAGGTPPARTAEAFPTPSGVADAQAMWAQFDAHHRPEALADWCAWRRLPREAAYVAGVRAARADIVCTLADWWPVRARMMGTWWPLYHPHLAAHPIAWRFRPLRPVTAKGREVKCISMVGPMARVSELVRPGSGTLIICEGEPDWLVWCALRPLATVVGLVHSRWRPEFGAWGVGCSTWAWVGHECDHEERVREQITEAAIAHGAHLVVRTVPESCDWADRWAR